jgi:hypothetical protein
MPEPTSRPARRLVNASCLIPAVRVGALLYGLLVLFRLWISRLIRPIVAAVIICNALNFNPNLSRDKNWLILFWEAFRGRLACVFFTQQSLEKRPKGLWE